MTISKLRQSLHKFFEPRLPAVACEIAPQFFSVVRLNARTPPAIDRYAVETFSRGLINPALTRPMVTSTSDFLSVLKSTLNKAEIKTSKISLAIPDACAKVAVHHFDTLPGNENEKLQLLKWKLKKTIPYNIDDSHLSYWEQETGEGKFVLVAVCIHKEVLSQLEGLFESLGIQVGYITLASFAAFELLVRQDAAALQKSVLFLRARPSDISSLIVQQGTMVFFRQMHYQADETPRAAAEPAVGVENEIPNLYDEIHPCLMYCQDKLGAPGVEKIYIAPFHNLDSTLLSSLSEKSNTPVLSLDPLPLFQWQQSGSLNSIKNVLTPTLGLALGKF